MFIHKNVDLKPQRNPILFFLLEREHTEIRQYASYFFYKHDICLQ